MKEDMWGVRWKPLPNYGDLFTLDEFLEDVQSGSFIDYDGTGYYSDGVQESNVEAVPSDMYRGRVDRRFTHVMWYNR